MASSYNKSVVDGKIAMWNKKEDDHKEKQMNNPFSEWEGASHRKVLDKNDPNYARPVAGTKTDIRGKQAGQMVTREVQELLHIIERIGTMQPNGRIVVLFGNLFEVYNNISNKLVGMLMRARKQGLVHFEGEMLWQRRDDHVPITLLVRAEEARK